MSTLMVDQVYWSTSLKRLPTQGPHILDQWPLFLTGIVDLLKKGKFSTTRLAIALVRRLEEYFPGIGVYHSAEIFHMAGMSCFPFRMRVSIILIVPRSFNHPHRMGIPHECVPRGEILRCRLSLPNGGSQRGLVSFSFPCLD